MLLNNPLMVVPGNRSFISPGNFTASPRRSPLDLKPSSPGSSMRYDNGGIGLGIVAALEKSGVGINRHQIAPRQDPVCYVESGSNRFNPVHCARRLHFTAEIGLSESEEYTCVTSRDGVSRVYYNDDEFETYQNRSDGDRKREKSVDIAEKSTAKKRGAFRDSRDFLSLCCLCKKKLQGRDIYMYKGDKGFCSVECRSVKIMEENLIVRHKSENEVELLSSPYARRNIPSAGIFVI